MRPNIDCATAARLLAWLGDAPALVPRSAPARRAAPPGAAREASDAERTAQRSWGSGTPQERQGGGR